VTFTQLLEFWRIETSNKKKPGSRLGLISNILKRVRKHNKLRFLFWFRLAQYWYGKGGILAAYARRLERKLNLKYGVDISVSARIGAGFRIAHLPGIVITGYADIGKNFFIRQNTTIGIKTLGKDAYKLKIGDNVSVGANSCIIGDDLSIGDNVVIGAMSFVNKNIPGNSTFYTKRVVCTAALSDLTPTQL